MCPESADNAPPAGRGAVPRPVRSVLMVCMGNICRSPSAEGVLRARLAAAGLSHVRVDSAGTHDYHVGQPPDRRSQHHAARRGYDLSALRARQVERSDFERFDLILANPPYIGTDEPLPPEVREHEPAGALFAGADGLDDYRAILPDIPRLLAPGGIAVFEIGWTQTEAVAALASRHGLRTVVKKDLAGRNRALVMS